MYEFELTKMAYLYAMGSWDPFFDETEFISKRSPHQQMLQFLRTKTNKVYFKPLGFRLLWLWYYMFSKEFDADVVFGIDWDFGDALTLPDKYYRHRPRICSVGRPVPIFELRMYIFSEAMERHRDLFNDILIVTKPNSGVREILNVSYEKNNGAGRGTALRTHEYQTVYLQLP